MLPNQKEKFAIPDHINYLNGAFMSPLLNDIVTIGEQAVRQKLSPWEITVDDFFANTRNIRIAYAKLINNPQPQRVVIIPSVSYGIANVTNNIDLAGGTIVVTGGQFPSNVYPWFELAKRDDGAVNIVEPPETSANRGELWNEKILQAINDSTKVVAISHIHWADGTRFDLQAIRRKTWQHDALLIVDGTQSVGALPFDIQEFKPDALICAGYKWLLGPYGIGVAYYGEAFDGGQPIEENWINRKGSEDFAALVDYEEEYEAGSLRYGMGEQSNFILAPMFLQAIQQLLEWQPENIQHYCKAITKEPIARLRDLGFWVEEDNFRSSHLFGVRHNNLNITHLKEQLEAANIYVSVRGDAIRVAPYVHNTTENMLQLVGVLESAIKT
jgi:selenocysteine lyase/cysteine desulfurase